MLKQKEMKALGEVEYASVEETIKGKYEIIKGLLENLHEEQERYFFVKLLT